MTIEQDLSKIKEALETYQDFNEMKNDPEAYLFRKGVWALYDGVKPDPKDYSIPAKEKP